MKKVILTGASGLIGKETAEPLKNADFEVFCPSSKECDLLDMASLKAYFNKVQPQYLLHFAWITGGDYLTNPINKDLVQGSLDMLKIFKENGGKRALYAGTCFEYKFKDEPIKEEDELNPQTLYAISKNELRQKAQKFSKENNLSFGWGRIFYVYGHNEKNGRLTSTIINNLKNNKPVTINCSGLIRDYMYTKDIANGFVKFLDTNYDGCVNICSGYGISLGEYAKTIARKMGKEDYLILKNEESTQPKIIIGDNNKLKETTGFNLNYPLDKAIENILEGHYEGRI